MSSLGNIQQIIIGKHRVLLGAGILAVCLIQYNPARAAADTSTPITCDGLSITLSDDKNFYIFTATASGDATVITGYSFNFGDHQSYQFNFAAAPTQDHHTANVTHTYRNPGTYTAVAKVHVKSKGKSAAISSPDCQTSVTIGPPGATLPNTGSQYAPQLFTALFILTTAAHHLWLRCRKYSIMQ